MNLHTNMDLTLKRGTDLKNRLLYPALAYFLTIQTLKRGTNLKNRLLYPALAYFTAIKTVKRGTDLVNHLLYPVLVKFKIYAEIYSTVTDLARFLGLSTSQPLPTAT